jgi:glycosyltransferase involved in cell wall biosynthesis
VKLLFVSQELPPETGWGGIGTYVDVLSAALSSMGVEVHVLSVVEGQPLSTRQVGSVTVHRHPLERVRGTGRLPPEAWRRLWLSLTAERLIRRLGMRPDVVECPEWMAEGLALAVRGKLPLVIRLHSGARQLFPYTRQGREWRGIDGQVSAWLEEVSARRANVVVSTRSNLDEVTARMRLDERALHAIPYPVRLPAISPMPSSESPRVTFVGRLEPRKGPDVLLRAAPKVLETVPDARFVFVGRDAIAPGELPSSAWLRREAERLGVSGAVELTGQLDRAGVDEQLRRASVCAFPSRWESFGNVVAESSATGRPVVASAIPPFRELVDDGVTGRIAPLTNPDAWAAAVVELLSDRDRAAGMGRAGAAHVARISDPARVADQALAAYEHAIARWRRGERAGRR